MVDASVAIKWYLPEPHDVNAGRLLQAAGEGEVSLHVPDLFFTEVGNILWKRVRWGELSLDRASRIPGLLASVSKRVHGTESYFGAALELACWSGQTVYDCAYLVLAASLECQMATADERLIRALAGTKWRNIPLWIGDY